MNKNDFLQWKENPATKEVMEVLKKVKASYIEAMMGYACEGNPVNSARAVGFIEGMEYLINLEYRDVQGDEE